MYFGVIGFLGVRQWLGFTACVIGMIFRGGKEFWGVEKIGEFLE